MQLAVCVVCVVCAVCLDIGDDIGDDIERIVRILVGGLLRFNDRSSGDIDIDRSIVNMMSYYNVVDCLLASAMDDNMEDYG